ncbi:hypothetical protein GQ44DRAFT_700812 [Phaeosphaeriaceae sp. PMI808]|nr:hypothetical protein GQ44DRAFT_700812 [Phaeosphaeriaceae sp. PMI808]
MRLARPSRKRKAIDYAADDDDEPFELQSPPKNARNGIEVVDHTEESPKKVLSHKKGKGGNDEPATEKRLKRYRAAPPQSYIAIKGRALTQRLIVLSRERRGTDQVPEEMVIMAGSTGNVYTQRIGLVPSCDCPHAKKGNHCKHIVYVMLRVLKAREDIAYQLALTSDELREVLKNAPAIPGVETDPTDAKGEQDGNRKPIEGECPICYDELDLDKDVIVYCKTSCGNNVHKDCMQKWISTSRSKATCPYCRAPWTAEDNFDGKLGDIDTTSLQKNQDGYINVASQLGLSRQRDYSTYNPFWVRQHLGHGGRRRRDYEEMEDDH